MLAEERLKTMAAETVDGALPGRHQKEMMSDEPITSKGQDRLGMDLHARALAAVVRNAPTPFTIALQGEWGSGKTSLMNLMFNLLCKEKDEKGTTEFYGVKVNAWRCALAASAPDEAASKVAGAIRDEIKKEAERIEALLDKQNGHKIMKSFNKIWTFIVNLLVLFWSFIKAAYVCVAERKSPQWMKRLSGSERDTALTLKVLGELLQDGAEEFSKKMEENIQTCVNDGKKGVVIFVDDLDRLESEYAVKTLDVLKNLFVINGCVFVLAIAYDVVAKGLRGKFGEKMFGYQIDGDDYECRAYFDKIIQLPFHMPLERYPIEKLIKEGLAGFWSFNDDRRLYIVEREGKIVRSAMGEHYSLRVSRPDWFKCVVQNSTGWNPRSVKRLKYLLSLVGVIYEENRNRADNESNPPEILPLEERYLCFVLVCLQIAYQHIYKKLLQQPEFTRWRVTQEVEGCPYKEDWMRAVWQAARETALKGREDEIITLLQLMECCVPSNKLRDTMKKLLDLLVLATGDGVAPPQPMDREEFFKYLGSKGFKSHAKDALLELFKKMGSLFTSEHGAEPLEYMYDEVGVRVFLGSSCLVEWEVDVEQNTLPYSFGDGEKYPELKNPLEVFLPNARIWEGLLEAYNREAPKEKDLPADFVRKHLLSTDSVVPAV